MDESGSAPWLREAIIASSRRTADWRARLVCGALLLSGPWVFCANPLRAQSAKTGESGQNAQAIRVEHSPKLDGTLDDPLWQSAVPVSEFHQREPYEGQ